MIAFHGTSFYTSTVGGNARWAAPELFCFTDSETPRSLTVQSDVYSFGCILLEAKPLPIPCKLLSKLTSNHADLIWSSPVLLSSPRRTSLDGTPQRYQTQSSY